jgi:hypothetical protein
MKPNRIVTSLALLFVLLLHYSANGKPGRSGGISPIYPPPLERAAIQVALDSLPHNISGDLPTYDGDIFNLGFNDTSTVTYGEQQIRCLVDSCLAAFRWTREPDELRLEDMTNLPPADSAFLEQEILTGFQESTARLTKEFGRLSQNTIYELHQSASDLRTYAHRTQRGYHYKQRCNGHLIENANINVIWMAERGVIGINGRIFNDVNLANAVTLSGSKALESGKRYLQKLTTVISVDHPDSEVVIMPYADSMRYAWKLKIGCLEGHYQVWIDAESGAVLQLFPLFYNAQGIARVFNPDPDAGTKEEIFDINPPNTSDNTSELKLDMQFDQFLFPILSLDVENYNGDNKMGPDEDEYLRINSYTPESYADFRTVQIKKNVIKPDDPDYNYRFQDINAFAWVNYYLHRMAYFGFRLRIDQNTIPEEYSNTIQHVIPQKTKLSDRFPLKAKFCDPIPLTILVNVDQIESAPGCYTGYADSPEYDSDSNRIILGVGSATLPSSSSNDSNYSRFNQACDATMVVHEAGHFINSQHKKHLPDFVNEGMADFWSMSTNRVPTIGKWVAQNMDQPPIPGDLPRTVDEEKTFPDYHQSCEELSNEAQSNYESTIAPEYTDGQILCWALWSSMRGMEKLGMDSGIERALLSALDDITFNDVTSDASLHEDLQYCLKYLLGQYGSDRRSYKLCSGFARAGICSTNRAAVIDIDRDFLCSGSISPNPIFTVWTGQDYYFDDEGNAKKSRSYNPYYQIEVANDPDFKVNYYSSGSRLICSKWDLAFFYVPRPVASWTLPDEAWEPLKTGSQLYYRVTTGGSWWSPLWPFGAPPVSWWGETLRCSSLPGAPAYAIIN